MNKKFVASCCAAVLALGLNAQEPPAPEAACPEAPPQMKVAANHGRMAPRREDAATIQRRREIITLVEAYKILPDEQKAVLKEEIVKRLHADFEAHQAQARKMAADMEKKLEAMKKHLSEVDADAMVAKEFERLLNAGSCPPAACAPAPVRQVKGAPCAAPQGKAPDCGKAPKNGKPELAKSPKPDCCEPAAECCKPVQGKKADCCEAPAPAPAPDCRGEIPAPAPAPQD